MRSSSLFILLFAVGFLIETGCAALRKKPKTTTTTEAKGNSTSMAFRKSITAYAEKQVGTPYKYAGKTPATGFDCSGFTFFVFKKFNIEVSPASKEQARTGKQISLDKVQPGDLVFFGKTSAKIDHVSMVVKRNKEGIFCVHSTSSRGVIVENVSVSSYWKPRILFARDVISH